MKYFILFMLLPLSMNAQIITEHIVDDTKTFSPLFGKEKGSMRVTLDLTFIYPNKDSIMTCLFDITDRKIKLEGVSNSTNITGVASAINNYGVFGGLASIGFGSNKAYSFNNTRGISLLNLNEFDTLLNNMSIMKKLAKETVGGGKTIIFRAAKIYLVLEMKRVKEMDQTTHIQKGRLEPQYYFQIDDSIFRLSESEFDDLYKNVLLEIKKLWANFIENRTIQYRMDDFKN